MGYRDTKSIRFNDQTEIVRFKALKGTNGIFQKQYKTASNFTHLPLGLQVLGRSIFFSYYVADFNRTLAFLHGYRDPHTAPEHLTLGIDAVSLAFLSHQVNSDTARALGRTKYSAALKCFNEVLRDPEMVRKPSTFESALFFDLFEKIMKPDGEVSLSSYAHVHGALALAKLRGISQLRSAEEVRASLGLAQNATIYALSTGNKIPDAVREIRKHAAQFVDTSDPKWKLSDIVLDVTDTEAKTLWMGPGSSSRCLKSTKLDKELEALDVEVSPTWTYQRKFISGHDPRRLVPDDFFPAYDVYPSRMLTQMWNVLRITRILLCEEIVDALSGAKDDSSRQEVERAQLTVTTMVREILASVPQMTNCDYAAQHKLPKDSTRHHHTHTTSHILDVYILIHPLYVVTWSRNCPPSAREWALSQLKHISEHFGIKEASHVVKMVEEQNGPNFSGRNSRSMDNFCAEPWLVYRMLGSYAFAAT